MSQSFWSSKEYQEFLRYTESLSKKHLNMSDIELKQAVKNWQRGVEKMTQIAIGFDVIYEAPVPSFLTYSKKDSITWITLTKLDGYKIGLWDGECTTIDGHPVFNPEYLNFSLAVNGISDITELDFPATRLAMMAVFKEFDGQPIIEGEMF